MSHTPARLAGLVAMLAALILAPPAIAGGVQASALKAKTKQHAKRCTSKVKRTRAAGGCTKATKKVATSKSSACTGVSRKRVKGTRTSAFVRCVAKERKKAAQDAAAGKQADDGNGVDSLDPDDNETDSPDDDVPLTDGSPDGAFGDLSDVSDGTFDATEFP